MRSRILSIIVFIAYSLTLQAQTTVTLDSTELTVDVLVDGIDIPWEILWGPDNHIWMTERYGMVSRVDIETGMKMDILDLSDDIYENAEAGLLGMLLHPDFDNEPYVYLVYTYWDGSDVLERLVRYTYNGTILINEEIMLDDIQGNNTHDGSRLLLLPDNTFLMTTGDAQAQSLPQNTNSLVGKTLRFNLDGSVPADNPIPGSYVWSYGHRNAQGLCLGPNDIIYSSEHGPTTDDELNILEAGKNYGWPDVEGYCDSPPEENFCNNNEVEEPIAAWSPTIAPSDITWYAHPSIPELNNHLLMTVLKEKMLVAFSMNEEGTEVIEESNYFIEEFGRLRDVCITPDGSIILATNGDTWANDDPFTHSLVRLRNLDYEPEDTVGNNIQDFNFQNVIVHPNPSNGQFVIKHSNLDLISIFDDEGQLISSYSGAQLADSLSIDLRSKAAGLYFIRFYKDGKEGVQKLIKL